MSLYTYLPASLPTYRPVYIHRDIHPYMHRSIRVHTDQSNRCVRETRVRGLILVFRIDIGKKVEISDVWVKSQGWLLL